MGYLDSDSEGLGLVGVSSDTADIAADPSEVLWAGLTYKVRMETILLLQKNRKEEG